MTHLNNIQAIWSSQNFLKVQRKGEWEEYEECEDSSHSLYPSHSPLLWTFVKNFGTSYGLDIVEIGSLHLGDIQMISRKSQIQKY